MDTRLTIKLLEKLENSIKEKRHADKRKLIRR